MHQPVLSVQDLTACFLKDRQWLPVVRGVSFDIAPKEIMAVVGESGSGKSVTAMSVMGLLPTATSRVSGSIRLAGRSLLGLPDEEMQRVRGNEIAMVFQEASLNPVYTIGFQLSETLVKHRGLTKAEARAEGIRLLEKVRIPAAKSRFDDYPHRLSGGMRQRVSIALALACKPKLLIADEPTTALDVTIQAQILELIKQLQEEEGMSVLFITHDMGVVAEIADRTTVMFRGEVVETASTVDIFTRPQHAYTKALLAAVPVLGSMKGRANPMPFPAVDACQGNASEPAEPRCTVDFDGRPVLQVSNLRTRFDIRGGIFGGVRGRVHAVENVSFDVRAGETLSLVGESGCGKSTTGRSIMRLLHPQEGKILVEGKNIEDMDRRERNEMLRRIQMIFQDPFASLNARMTVGEAIGEPLRVHTDLSRQEIADKVADLLKRVGLKPEMAFRFPHQFSGGQRQRICVARALALEPKLIVADESVSALDVSIKAQVINLMLDLQERLGLAYLFISHDMAVVERISHRVAVMYLGEIVEIGPRAAVFDNPQHAYTRKLMEAVPIPDPSRRAMRRGITNSEIKSPIRPADYVPPVREMREVSPGHFVQIDTNTFD